jgi:hypothetical protein
MKGRVLGLSAHKPIDVEYIFFPNASSINPYTRRRLIVCFKSKSGKQERAS